MPRFPLTNDNAGETYVYPASLFRRGSVPPPTGRIPREIVEFFNAPGGHSLIAKGPAGTGKTTFALQLTEALGEVTASHYLSSRVSDESLYRQFTWLKDRIKPAILQTGSKSPRDTKVARHALHRVDGPPGPPASGLDDREAPGPADPATSIPLHTRWRAPHGLRHPGGSSPDEAASVEARERPVEGRGQLRARAARPADGGTLPRPRRRVRDFQRGALGLRRLAPDRDHLQFRRPRPRRGPRAAAEGQRRIPPGTGQPPPPARRIRLAGARLRVGHPGLCGRLADRPPHGGHERRLGLEMVERGVPTPEVRASVPRLHGVRYARVRLRRESLGANVRRVLRGPPGERRVRRIRDAADRFRRETGEPRPGRASSGQHQRFRGPLRSEAVHGVVRPRLGLVRRGPESGPAPDRMIGSDWRKRAPSSRSASIKIENRIEESLISITE